MGDVNLFQTALGLASPWYVDRTEFDAEARRIDPCVDVRLGGRFTGPECGKGVCPAHDTTETKWRHLERFQHEAFLHARFPRGSCETCGAKSWRGPGPGAQGSLPGWATDGNGALAGGGHVGTNVGGAVHDAVEPHRSGSGAFVRKRAEVHACSQSTA